MLQDAPSPMLEALVASWRARIAANDFCAPLLRIALASFEAEEGRRVKQIGKAKK